MCLGMANGGKTITLQEALDVIKKKISTSNPNPVDNICMTIISMAASRQIAEKPIAHFVPDGISENNTWQKGKQRFVCPHCNEYVLEYMSHCDKCGQNLDWSSFTQQKEEV